MFWKIAVLVALLASGFLTGCDADDEESHSHEHSHEQDVPKEYASLANPFTGDSGATVAGEQLFKVHCASCHGNTGQGDGPDAPSAVPDWTVENDILTASDGMLYWHIADGLRACEKIWGRAGAADFASDRPRKTRVISGIWRRVCRGRGGQKQPVPARSAFFHKLSVEQPCLPGKPPYLKMKFGR